MEAVRRALPSVGYQWTKRGIRRGRSPVDRVLGAVGVEVRRRRRDLRRRAPQPGRADADAGALRPRARRGDPARRPHRGHRPAGRLGARDARGPGRRPGDQPGSTRCWSPARRSPGPRPRCTRSSPGCPTAPSRRRCGSSRSERARLSSRSWARGSPGSGWGCSRRTSRTATARSSSAPAPCSERAGTRSGSPGSPTSPRSPRSPRSCRPAAGRCAPTRCGPRRSR